MALLEAFVGVVGFSVLYAVGFWLDVKTFQFLFRWRKGSTHQR